MKILITGGAGFIGANFIRHWIKNYPRDEIINLDALTYAGNQQSLAPIVSHKYYRFVHGNICDPKAVLEAMDGTDVVVHFAAESHVDRSITGPKIFLETNVVGTQVLLDAALKLGVKRFHHISTDEVFGALALGEERKFNEASCYDPHNPYSASKAAADHLVRAYYHTYGLPATITNCSNNFGPFQFPEKIIPLFITNLIDGQKVPVYGDGLYVRDWLFVTDHCQAIELSLTKGKAGETYCVGGGTEISNLDLTTKILELMGKDESMIEYVKDRPGHDRRYAIDPTKIKSELGWKTAQSFDKALASTIKWYQENEDWWRPLKEKHERT